MSLANFDQFHEVLAMLTGLFQIAYVVALLFIPIGILLALVGIPLFGRVIKRLKNTGGKVSVRKIGFLFILSLFLIGICFIPTYNTNAISGTAGTAGSLSVSSSSVSAGSVLSIEAEGLDSSADYDLRFTPGCASNRSYTTGSSQTSRIWHIKISKPTSGDICVIELGNTTAGNTGILDEITVDVTDAADFIGADMFMDLLAPLAILGVAAVLLGTFIQKKYRQ